MINKETVQTLTEEWLKDNDYFLVDINFAADDRIVIEIDHADGVWIDDCAELSRFLTLDGKKMQGVLKAVDGDNFTVTVQEKQKQEGKKRPVLVDVDKTFQMDGVKYAKYLLAFK